MLLPYSLLELYTVLNSVLQTSLTNELQQVKARRVVHPAPAESILDVAACGEFDLVVLIARSRSFWGDLFERSVTAQVLLSSGLPVLVLPAR